MLKRVLSKNRIFGAVVCVLVFIAAGLLYIQSAKRKVARDVPPLRETAKPQQPPQTGAQPPGTAQGGHWHADGTYHAEPHVEGGTPGTSATAETATTPSQKRGEPPQTTEPQATSEATGVSQQLPKTQVKDPKTGYTPEQAAAVAAIHAKYNAEAAPYESALLEIEAKHEALRKEFKVYTQEVMALSDKRSLSRSEKARRRELRKLTAEATRLQNQYIKRTRELMKKRAALGDKRLEDIRSYHRSVGLSAPENQKFQKTK